MLFSSDSFPLLVLVLVLVLVGPSSTSIPPLCTAFLSTPTRFGLFTFSSVFCLDSACFLFREDLVCLTGRGVLGSAGGAGVSSSSVCEEGYYIVMV